jgi:glycosyltransferase involved in cell wall biosynthesis
MDRRPADLLPEYRLDWHDLSADWSVAPECPQAAEQIAQPILGAPRDILFEIVAPAEVLDRLSIRLATFARSNSVALRCELLDQDGTLLLREYSQPETIADNAFHQCLDLRTLQFERGRKFWVRLDSPDATTDNCFGAWARRTIAGRYQLPARISRLRGDRLFVYRDQEASSAPDRELQCYAVLGGDHSRARETLELLDEAFPGEQFTVLDLGRPGDLARIWPRLAEADVVAFCDVHPDEPSGGAGYDALAFELYRRGACTIFVDRGGFGFKGKSAGFAFADGMRDLLNRRVADERRCRFVLHRDPPRLIDSDKPAQELWEEIGAASPGALGKLVSRTRSGRLPRVAIVSVLYNKADVIEPFIHHVVDQSFPGEIALVLVDDRSPQDDVKRARALGAELAANGVGNRSIKIVQNKKNLGNCASRLVGLGATEADVYIVIDCDCLINRDFVAAHVFEHARDDVDAVIGPLNIESWDRDPAALVEALDADPARVKAESSPQDPVQPDGFVNCITRNFSTKRRIVEREPLFDVDFGYSARPGSGFGWEDVEMGYRLYAHGDVIRFTDRAFSVHVSHDSSTGEAAKIEGSFRNFDRLFAKHPEMALAARRWAVDTYGKMQAWAAGAKVDAGAPQRALEARFEEASQAQKPLVRSYRPGARRLRILTYRWHVPHQYELYKLPHDFTLATQIGENAMVNAWGYDQRPLRPNVGLVPAREIDPRDYDLAVLHFDENSLSPNLCNNVIPTCWGEALDWLIALPDLPKVAICHGTPQFVGQYALNPAQLASFEVHEDERLRLVRHFADAGVKVVCNSWQALDEWGFADSRVIWHGFDPQEFPAGTQARHILALGQDRHRPHYRGAWEHAAIRERLDPRLEIETAAHDGASLDPRGTNAFAVRNFRSYVDRIRQFTAYLNTTLRSPMPRARGEAMMTGVIPVALANHDVERFIEPGKNGFIATDPLELADWLNHLFRRPGDARRIAAAARRTAMDLFNHDRYLTSWTELIEDAVGERLVR